MDVLCLQELEYQVDLIYKVVKEVFVEIGLILGYKVGIMIEIFRVVFVVDEVYGIFYYNYVM